ncbi:MAG: hypothetical protein PF508_04365 [Spirochaeta sp.]|nr:hypothetical protein [Spirochaeta sp.]
MIYLDTSAFLQEMDDATVDHLLALFADRLRRGQYTVADIDRARLATDVREISGHTGTIGSRSLDVVHVAVALQLEALRHAVHRALEPFENIAFVFLFGSAVSGGST